jgi:hypothetical protein
VRFIEGAELRTHKVNSDLRGELAAFEDFDNLPFPLERVFFIKAGNAGVQRGGHANSCDEAIIALSGSVTIEADNGYQKASIRLAAGNELVWIKPGVVVSLLDFAADTILLVCASARFSDTRHYHSAQPHLILADKAA